jgi:Ca2+/Na+ antiporter
MVICLIVMTVVCKSKSEFMRFEGMGILFGCVLYSFVSLLLYDAYFTVNSTDASKTRLVRLQSKILPYLISFRFLPNLLFIDVLVPLR